MKKMILMMSLTLSLCLMSQSAHAETAASANPSSRHHHVPEETDCRELASRIKEIHRQLRSVQNRVSDKLYELKDVFDSWYASVSTIEGTTVYIPQGHFHAIKTSADSAQALRKSFESDFNDLHAQLADLSTDFSRCR